MGLLSACIRTLGDISHLSSPQSSSRVLMGTGDDCPTYASPFLGISCALGTGKATLAQLTLAEPKMEAVCSSFSSSSLRGWMIRVMWHVLSVANLRKAPTT